MTKFTPTPLTNLQNESTAVSNINTNLEALETCIETTLSRDGTAPNEMASDLDMNSNKIINLPAAITNTEPVRKAEFDAAQLGVLALGSTGVVVADTSTSALTRTITGTANEVTVTDGTGISGNPTISLPSTLTFTGKTITGGTFASGSYPSFTMPTDANLPGNPTTTTQTAGNNTTRIATTAFVTAAVSASVTGVSTVNGQGGDILIGFTPGGRLSLTTATPVSTVDSVGATTIFLCMTDKDMTMIYDGSNWVPREYTGELSLALDNNSGHTNYHQSGKNFDVWEYWDGSAVVIGSGPAWTSDTGRGSGAGTTELEMYKGRLVNKNSTVIRFGSASGNTATIAARKANIRGSFRTTADGTTEDSFLKRFLSNLNNAVPRILKVIDGGSWDYTTSVYRPSHGSSSNKVEYLQCATGRTIDVEVNSTTFNTPSNNFAQSGIGIDSTTVNGAFWSPLVLSVGGQIVGSNILAKYKDFANLGYHYLVPLEYANTNGTQTWSGAMLIAFLGLQ